METFTVTSPLLSLTSDTNTCLLCDFIVEEREKKKTLSFRAIQNLKEIAKRWSLISPESSYATNFDLVWDKIKGLNDGVLLKDVKWVIHSSCRRNFSNEQKLSTNSKNQVSDQAEASENIECTSIVTLEGEVETEIPYGTKFRTSSEKNLRRRERIDSSVCFGCLGGEKKSKVKGEIVRDLLSRVELDVGYDTLKQSIKRNENSSDPWLKAAAQKLNSIISNQDIFSADVTYHKKCYDRFTYVNKYEKRDKEDDENSSILTAEREFITVLKRKVVHQKFCYLLRDLVGEMNSLDELFDCAP